MDKTQINVIMILLIAIFAIVVYLADYIVTENRHKKNDIEYRREIDRQEREKITEELNKQLDKILKEIKKNKNKS